MSLQYTNIRVIMDKIMRHPLMADMTFETGVDYTVDFMRIVGVPDMFEDKVILLHVKDYRASLPCDFHSIILMKHREKCMRSTTDSFHMETQSNHFKKEKDRPTNPLFFAGHELTYNGENRPADDTYRILGGIVYFNLKNGKVDMSYKAVALDDEGLPKLIDNSSFTKALEAYIKKEWFTILFDLSKITRPVFENALLDYTWRVGDCESEFARLSLDDAESFFNMYRTLIIRDNEHARGFRNSGTKEKLRVTR